MSDIQLNLINHSNDTNNSEVVIFSKNLATSFGELAIAWTVIQNLGQGFHHPFVYPQGQQVAVSDSWGNFSLELDAEPGQSFVITQTAIGDSLISDGASASPNEIEVKNGLEQGSINAWIYKDGRVFASETGIEPGQKAVFEFKPTIYFGVASEVTAGQVMDSAIISEINTEISLLGIASADIIMTGGGTGPDATEFMFTLDNVVYA